MISAIDVVIKYSKEVIDGASFTIMDGDKIGIVGPNGAGKSTLFRAIMGDIKPSSGRIEIAKNTRLGFLPQVIYDDYSVMDSTIYDYFMSVHNLKELEDELNQICEAMEDGVDVEKKMDKYIVLQDRFQMLGGYELEGRLKKVIKGLGAEDFDLQRKMWSLSGGEKSKIALARLIFSEPDVMLMDEPTNHLDKDMLRWVVDFLKKYKKALVIISHDQTFLDEVVNRIYYVSHENLEIYHGNYSKFVEQKKERDDTLQRVEKNREREEKRILDYVNKMQNISGRRKRQVKSRMKQLDRLSERK
ncbi:MAG: ATP-binding cassette domain-containing protein [Patescibacteria group bacterium]